jgi:hypothetical protein
LFTKPKQHVILKFEFFLHGNENTRFYFTNTKQSSYYLNLFHESIYFRIYVGFPHPSTLPFSSLNRAWISRNKLKSKLRLKSEILLKFEKSQKNAFLEKNLAQINLSYLPTKLKSKNKVRILCHFCFLPIPITIYPPLFPIIICVFPVTSRKKNHWFAVAYSDMFILGR